jgi:Tfp pilus assembly PilM family ATPase/Tfp pilus assembly protein PilN
VIDLDVQVARILAGEGRGGRVQVARLVTVPIPGGDAGDAGSLRNALQPTMDSLGGAARVLGIVGRSHVVLRDIRVPDAPPGELPAIVRFQAMRELSVPVEQAAVDYDVVAPPGDDKQRPAILAGLPNEVIARFRTAVSGPKRELVRLGFRPYATLRAYRELAGTPAEAVLLVSAAQTSLELNVVRGDGVLFSRATTLRNAVDPAAGEDTAAAIVMEVRRTLAAFANQSPGVEVRRIALAAGPSEHAALVSALSSALGLPVDRFDPLAAVDVGSTRGADADPADRGAYAAAIGAAISAAQEWRIDFLNPKRPVVTRSRRKPVAMLVGVAAALVIGVAYLLATRELANRDTQIKQLSERQAKLKKALKSGADIQRRYAAIAEWTGGEVNWLDVLRRLSDEFPDTRKAHANSVTMTRDATGGTLHIRLDGVARDQAVSAEFQTRLNRGDYFSARPRGSTQRNSRARDYPWHFETDMTLQPPTANGNGAIAKAGAKPAEPTDDSTGRRTKATPVSSPTQKPAATPPADSDPKKPAAPNKK